MIKWILLGVLLMVGQDRVVFDRIVLLENEAVDSASVSVGGLNGDGLPDLIFARGRHRPFHDRVLLNDGKGGIRGIESGANARPDLFGGPGGY